MSKRVKSSPEPANHWDSNEPELTVVWLLKDRPKAEQDAILAGAATMLDIGNALSRKGQP